jgi:hypothetical protein
MLFSRNGGWSVHQSYDTCTLTWKGVKVGETRGRKQGNLEHTVVPNVALWNFGSSDCELFCQMYLQANNQVLMNMCVNSRAWLYKSTTFFPSEKKVNNTTLGTGANLQHRSSAADATITRLLNRLSSCSLSADLLCADWSLTKSRTRLSRQFYWKTLQAYSTYYMASVKISCRLLKRPSE